MKLNINRKKVIKYLLVFSVFILYLSIFYHFSDLSFADVGNINRYDNDSDYDSSYSDFEGGDTIFMFFHLFNILGPIPTLIIIVIVAVIYVRAKKSANNMGSGYKNPSYNANVPINAEAALDEIRKIDPDFSADNLLTFAREVFLKLQSAWTKRDWKIVRPFESNELFATHKTQLDEYINAGKINVVEKIAINAASIRDFRVDGDKELLLVALSAVMRDYVIDEKTKKVLESDPNRDYHMNYLMTFMRKSGVKTIIGKNNMNTTNCPNCGAPTEITSSGKCEYCDSVITTGDHGWVLSDIRKLN